MLELQKVISVTWTPDSQDQPRRAGVSARKPANAIEAYGQTRRLQGAAFGGD
jgi:hypothetical protein